MSKWQKVKLGSLGDFRTGGTPSRSKPEYFCGNIPWITTVSLGESLIGDGDAVEHISEQAVAESATKIIQANSIMVGMRVGVGKVSINTVPMCTNQDIVSIENINDGTIHKPYLIHCIRSNTDIFTSQKRGATIQGVTTDVIRSLEIPIPPLETQKRIAKTLDAAVELLAMQEQQLVELGILTTAIFSHMFGGFESCESKTLIEVIVDGAGLSYGIVQPGDDIGSGVGIIRPVDITDGILSLENIKHVPPDVERPYKKTRLSGNEILVTVRGTTGDTALTDYRCFGMNVTRGIAVVRPDDRMVNPVFLNECLKSVESQRYIQNNTKGATLRQINLSALKELTIPIPPLSTQTQFAEIVTKIEEQKVLVKKAIDETQYLFDSLMSQYFE